MDQTLWITVFFLKRFLDIMIYAISIFIIMKLINYLTKPHMLTILECSDMLDHSYEFLQENFIDFQNNMGNNSKQVEFSNKILNFRENDYKCVSSRPKYNKGRIRKIVLDFLYGVYFIRSFI